MASTINSCHIGILILYLFPVMKLTLPFPRRRHVPRPHWDFGSRHFISILTRFWGMAECVGDARMEDTLPQKSWKQLLDQKLHRLHSLLFGLEAAIEREEWEKALGLGLCLLGFLESESRTEEDWIYIDPIKKLVQEHIDVAKDKHYKIIEHKAFAQAGRPEGAVFGGHYPVDIGRIKDSQFYRPFMSASRLVHASETGIDPPSASTDVSRPANRIHTDTFHPTHEDKNETMGGRKRGRPDPERIRTDENEEATKSSAFATGKQKRIVDSFKKGATLHPIATSTHQNERNALDENTEEADKPSGFVTAKQKWAVDSLKKGATRPGSAYSYQNGGNPIGTTGSSNNRTLGIPRRGVRSSFIPPVRPNGAMGTMVSSISHNTDNNMNESTSKCMELLAGPDGELPDKLRNLEPRLLEHISNEIMERDSNVRWEDIAGLDHAKKSVTEMVIWPLLRPDIFNGCRSPGKGLLLFGPPGTGKTMIGKAIAGEAKATFFSISASSLTSKWIGEGEKLVRALFGVASCRQPAVIFIDEVDSLLSQRKADGEHESSRRIKTEFLIEMEGIGSGNEQLLLIGATNRPQELDEAARRRFSKRLYIPLPSSDARAWIIRNLLQKDGLFFLSDNDIDIICSHTEGYSGSDMKNLVKEASMWPLREALREGQDISKISKEEMRSITLKDFNMALQHVRPSVSKSELGTYEDWNSEFGSVSL